MTYIYTRLLGLIENIVILVDAMFRRRLVIGVGNDWSMVIDLEFVLTTGVVIRGLVGIGDSHIIS